LNGTALDVLREARRARAEALRGCCQALMRGLRQMVSDGLSTLARPRVTTVEAIGKPRPRAVADS
jgi:hypothetical protein